MGENTFTFFGVAKYARHVYGLLDTHWTWFGDHILVWEKNGLLYRFYKDAVGNCSEPESMGLKVDHGVTTTHGWHLFLWLSLNWERDSDFILQKLDETEPEITKNLLLACDVTTQKRQLGDLMGLHLTQIRGREHPALRFLADPDAIDPSRTEYWGGWGMPNGQIIIGPFSRIIAQLDGLRRSNWDTLTDWQRYNLVMTLVRQGDVPREVKMAGLEAFYHNRLQHDTSDWAMQNAPSKTKECAEINFGLHENDVTALPYF